jgi:hypothetical protein
LEFLRGVDEKLAVLTFGHDTPCLELVTKRGGHNHPSLFIQAVEVLAKEHFVISRPSVLSSDPIPVSVCDTITHIAPHVNSLPPNGSDRDATKPLDEMDYAANAATGQRVG